MIPNYDFKNHKQDPATLQTLCFTPRVRLIYLNRNHDLKSWFWFTVVFERLGNRISNWVDHIQFMILSDSIIQDGRDGVLHPFISANQKYDSETCKSSSVQVSKRIKYIPWIIESQNWNIVFVKWQDHVYDFEIMIWNHVSDSGKSNPPQGCVWFTWIGIRIGNHDSDSPFYLSESETGFRIGWIILSLWF